MRFVVTAGPTREPLDPVRYLSNRSSGKMGFAIAVAAREAGHDVTLIAGPVQLPAPAGVELVRVHTSDEMYEAVRGALPGCDVFVMCAAVADYKPARVSAQKIKKGAAALDLPLVATRDILATIAAAPRDFLAVGFAAETENVEENARRKLRAKECDAIVANDVSGPLSGMESDENEVVILFRDAENHRIARTSKKNIARELVKIFSNMREKCLTKKM